MADSCTKARGNKKISIALSAGEASGDMYGAYLALELRSILGDVEIWGAGGNKMREAGVDIVVDTGFGGTIGIAQTLKYLPRFFVDYHKLKRTLLRRNPDVFVPIDFGAFNIRLGKIMHINETEIVYYFPPSSWRRRAKNAEALVKCGGKVITPYPWSAELLNKAGIDAQFVGHPLLDIAKPSVSKKEFFSEFDLDESLPTVGLLPGSRMHEISSHIIPLVESAKIIDAKLGGAQFIIPAASKADYIRKKINCDLKIVIIENRTYDCMANCDLLLATSGTATLEAAIIGTPMIIFYRGTSIMRFEFIFRKAILESFIGLPNLIAQKLICPELLGDDVNPEYLSKLALDILQNPDKLNLMKNELKNVRDTLGTPGATRRAAQKLIEMAGLI